MRSSISIVLFLTLYFDIFDACHVKIINRCGRKVELYDNHKSEILNDLATSERFFAEGMSNMLRVGKKPDATLAEFSNSGGRCWYDISAIPTGKNGPQDCKSKAECSQWTGGTGFNVQMAIFPSEDREESCKRAICDGPECSDAYLFPSDDLKTRSCKGGTKFKVILCSTEENDGPKAVEKSDLGIGVSLSLGLPNLTMAPAPAPLALKDNVIAPEVTMNASIGASLLSMKPKPEEMVKQKPVEEKRVDSIAHSLPPKLEPKRLPNTKKSPKSMSNIESVPVEIAPASLSMEPKEMVKQNPMDKKQKPLDERMDSLSNSLPPTQQEINTPFVPVPVEKSSVARPQAQVQQQDPTDPATYINTESGKAKSSVATYVIISSVLGIAMVAAMVIVGVRMKKAKLERIYEKRDSLRAPINNHTAMHVEDL